VALACGYRHAASCRSLAGFEAALRQIGRQQGDAGPALIHVRIVPGSLAKLGRPTVGPEVVARRFQAFLNEGAAG
jgi:phosphonopyruvate decarboxylase